MASTDPGSASTLKIHVAGRTTHVRFHFQQVYVSSRHSVGVGTPHWVPPVDLYETESEVVLEVDLAGVTSEEIGIRFTSGCIQLTGQRRDRAEPSATAFHVVEIERGRFSRDIELPATVDPDSAKASYDEGLLVIRARKRPGAVQGCRIARTREGLE